MALTDTAIRNAKSPESKQLKLADDLDRPLIRHVVLTSGAKALRREQCFAYTPTLALAGFLLPCVKYLTVEIA